jgi:RNA 3'-phosphate cyclase
MRWIEIDGSYLEGGGQILRTACGMSAATGQACRIVSIRKGRAHPGLAAQHLCGVMAVGQMCEARLEGASIGSQELTFVPAALQPPAEIHAQVGTAGAVTLVLQGLMIPLSVAGRAVEVAVSGGTHVPWAPTADYFGQVFACFLGWMGVRIELLEQREGFYPRGGGSVRVRVEPGRVGPLVLTAPGELESIRARSIATEDLRRARVAERQLDGARKVLDLDREATEYVRAFSTGSAMQMTAHYANCRLGACALGERGKKAERVGAECAGSLKRQMAAGACLDEHMADQILPYLALAGGESRVSVAAITDHCRTNMWVIEQFLPVHFDADEKGGLIRCLA